MQGSKRKKSNSVVVFGQPARVVACLFVALPYIYIFFLPSHLFPEFEGRLAYLHTHNNRLQVQTKHENTQPLVCLLHV